MLRSDRKVMVFLLVFFIGVLVFPREKQAEPEEKLREEILAVYRAKGEPGLGDFFKKSKNLITKTFIVDFAEAGLKERKEEWLKACEIMAEEKKDEKTLAEIYFRIGKYSGIILEYKKAHNSFEKALPIFLKLKDYDGEGNLYLETGLIYYHSGDNVKASEMYEKALKLFLTSYNLDGQGNVYFRKGLIYFFSGDNSKAFEMYEKALICFKKAKKPLGQGHVYLSKGHIYFYTGKITEASEMYEKALPLYEKAEDTTGIGNYYICKGDLYFSASDIQKALEMYDKALSLFNKSNDFMNMGTIFFKKGNIFLMIGDNIKALEMYDNALTIVEKTRDPLGQGIIYMKKGLINVIKGETSTALEMYQKSLTFMKRAEEPRAQGNLYKNMADLYLRTDEKSKALEMYKKALPFFRRARDLYGQGDVFESIGHFYQYENDNLKAMNMYDKALIFFKKDGAIAKQGEIYFNKGRICSLTGKLSAAINMFDKAEYIYQKANYQLGLGSICYEKGNIYLISLDVKKAFEYYDKALNFYEKVGYINGQGNVYWRKGDIYLKSGNDIKAIEMYEKSSQLLEKANDTLGQGNVFLQREDIYLRNGDYSKALDLCEKALKIYEKIGNKVGQGNVYLKKGEILMKAGVYSKALEVYGKAMLFYEKADDITGQGNIYKASGDIYFKDSKYSEALNSYEKALLIYEKIGDNEDWAFTLHSKAKALDKQNGKNDAHNLFDKSILKLENVRDLITFSGIRGTFMEKVYDQYEETVLFMLENKYDEKGFQYAESMRARVFLDQMAEGLVPLDKGLKPQLKEERDNLVGKLSALSRQLHETPGNDEKKLQELKDEYHRVESQFDDLLIKIRLDNPLYASVHYPLPVSVHDIQTDVLKKGESLLSFFISPDKTYAFIVSRDNFKMKPLPTNGKDIDSYAHRFLLALKENNPNDMNRFGSLLYDKLFKPLDKYLKKSRDIIIVPSGPLETIPFESLIVSKKNPEHPVYLLEKFRVKYVQNASLLSILRKYYTKNNNGANTANSFIGFGDPIYERTGSTVSATESTENTEFRFSHEGTRSDTKEKNLSSVPSVSSVVTTSPQAVDDEIKEIHHDRFSRAGGSLNPLPNSGPEILSIAHLFEKKSLKTKVLLQDQASEENAKAAHMKDFAFIHFSCHGLLNDDFQSLVLSQLPAEKSQEDGYFTLNEIMNCDYNAQLVVLSACDTGSGKISKGEGVTGLTRAFMYAGTPAVVASLWKVDDSASKELMVLFYTNLLEKKLDKVEALRLAKLELLKNPGFASPFYWSAFVLYGE